MSTAKNGKRPNAFSVALAAARNKEDAPEELDANDTDRDDTNADVASVAAPDDPPATALPEATEAPETSGVVASEFTPPPLVGGVKMGRPPGKRSDPSYMQMTAYIPIDLHEDMKEELLRVNRDRRRQKLPALEISDVVETQLGAWLRTQRGERANV